jgi:hypothetical protein
MLTGALADIVDLLFLRFIPNMLTVVAQALPVNLKVCRASPTFGLVDNIIL